MDLKQFEGMNVATARKNKEQEEDALDLKNKRNPKATKEKPLKEVLCCPILSDIRHMSCDVHESATQEGNALCLGSLF